MAFASSDPRPEPVVLWHPRPGSLPRSAWFGMATRGGGVSTGPYASLNLGLRVGDLEDAVRENRRRLREAIGIPDDDPRMLHQVHGRALVSPLDAPAQADGFVVRAGDPWVGVSAADCAPVAIVARDGASGALLHCGWRGARDRIGLAAVEGLAGLGVGPDRLRVAVGPCLHACCFPVGPEVAAQFHPSLLRPHPSGQPSLDLPEAIRACLVSAGVPSEAIQVAPDCTSCSPHHYFSHRRDRGITGRHWALLRLEAGPA